jgi:hypothetical protein
VTPTRGIQFDAWWIDPQKERTLNARLPEVPIPAPPAAASGATNAATDAATDNTADATAAPAPPAEEAPKGGIEWWRWAMAAAILAMAILRWQRRRNR